MRKPNSQECMHNGRKLSNVCCDNIEVGSGSDYVCIGSDHDDEIYDFHGDKMLKERVTITVFADVEGAESCIEIDLEDVLRFSATYCYGIYERVLKEVKL